MGRTSKFSESEIIGAIKAVEEKVTSFAAMKKLPKEMDKAKLAAAQTSLADIQKATAEAADTAKAGNMADAVTKGNAVKAKVQTMMSELGLSAPAAATTKT